MPDLLLLSLTLLALVGHAVLVLALVNRIHAYGWNRKLVDIITAACAAWLLAVPCWAIWNVWSRGGLETLCYSGPLAWYGILCALTTIAAGMHSVWLMLHPERRGTVRSRNVTKHNLVQGRTLEELASPVPRAFCRLPGNQVLQLRVEEKRLAIPNLPEGLIGLKIAHLTDLHISGRFARGKYEEIIDLTNRWRPDLVALTGDLVERDECLDWVDTTYGRLQASLGVYYVLGNHDKKCSHEEVRRRLDACGAVDLGGAARLIDASGGPIELVGNELPWFAPAGDFTSDTAFRVVLSHGPDQFDWAIERHAGLMLAGHTHGGQVRLPVVGAILSPSVYGARYACGVFQRGGTVMHVSRGTGSMAPFRYLCPPELSLLVLERA